MKKIVIEEKMSESNLNKIKSIAKDYIIEHSQDVETAKKMAEDAEIVFCGTPSVAHAAKHAKWVGTFNAGVNDFIMPGYLAKGCILSNCAGAYGVSISEHMILMILMLYRHIQEYQKEMKENKWYIPRKVNSIYKSKILVLGAGNIGTTFAKRARGFEPEKIIGITASGNADTSVFDIADKTENFEKYLSETDILALALPETKDTVGIISKKQLDLLTKNAIILNVGRGSAINQDALIDALNSERIAGAALDVMTPEPLPVDSKLRTAKNIFLTPHMAGHRTLEYTMDKCIEMLCEDLKNYIAGKELIHKIDLKKSY